MVILQNQGIFNQDEFGENRVRKNSMLHKLRTNPNQSNWRGAYINRNSLSDEVAFLQYGQKKVFDFNQMSFDSEEPSRHTTWPTKENPGSLYKLTSIWLEQGITERIIERKTYSLLEWLGDVGGLVDGLYLITSVLMQPITRYAMRIVLLNAFLG